MEHLNTVVRLELENSYNSDDLFPRLDWNVQQDPALDEASADKVRERFVRWVKEGSEQGYWLGTPRFQACVMIDKRNLDSVVKGPPPED
ncbi:hypothetical protein K458DRAFT_384001 [Lentithecium fluviatile CBS 122367]|uniref:Uncharacterized protein n=1 Tax=Lentithecium fluviatile CBS 122367 TaxID=1168545 RepID=A0A6G1JGI6_9PLEO|nr:hypothetical protein K458DRAFT_384001 [Lentithecium fluviatile CBS 122367]